jgi:uncharacterized protein (DUF952 family)
MTTPILHITTRSQWETAVSQGCYSPPFLASEGFIHCSTPGQVVAVANARYRGQTDLALLVIDPAQTEADLVYEDCYETGQEFPHLYGPLNLDAVTAVLDFPPNPDGTFTLPPLPG